MSAAKEQRDAERALYRQVQAYYETIRIPWLERITFALALLAAIGVSLRRFGIGITDYLQQGQWLTLSYWISLVLFVALDGFFVKARHPIPAPLGPFNPSRILEKFTMQGRLWQLALVLVLPLAARLVAAVLFMGSVK